LKVVLISGFFSIIVAMIGLIGIIIGAIGTILSNWFISKKELEIKNQLAIEEQKDKYKLAALDKRLEVHQKAYSLWYELIYASENERGDILKKCGELWHNNCLYLGPKSRKAFHDGLLTYRALKIHKIYDDNFLEKKWSEIRKVSDIIEEEVGLPAIRFDEKEFPKNNN